MQIHLASRGMREALQGAAQAPLIYAAGQAAEYYQTPERLRRGFTAKQVGEALGVLMSGPKATRPTWRALRKTILRMKKGLSVSGGGWRKWPHVREQHNAI